MLNRHVGIGLVLVALACAPPAPVPEAPPEDIAAVRMELDSLWTRYATAAKASDIDALAQVFSDSLHLVELGLPTVRGMTEWRSVVTEILSGVRILDSRVRAERTELMGDHVLQIGAYRDVLQPTGQPVQAAHGRFAAVMQRDDVGAWRVTRLIAFPDSVVPHDTTVE